MSEQEATVDRHTSIGSIWKTGDAIWWYEPPRYRGLVAATYQGMLCISEREVGPKGGIRKPAVSVTIKGRSWASVKRAVHDLGFTMPTLTARELKERAGVRV